MKTERTVIANDFHGKFRDRIACKLLFGFIRREKPDRVILNGDIGDFYTISRFIKDPRRKWDLQDECDDVVKLLKQIRACAPKAKIVYIEGNHEARLRTFLNGTSPALASIRDLQLESLLHLKSLGIKYIAGDNQKAKERDRGGMWLGDLFVYHGCLIRAKAGYTAHAELAKNGCSGISGHSHRDGKAPIRNRNGQFCWWENFCMCQLDAEYITGVADWTQGWSMVTTIGKRPDVEPVAVLGGKYTYRGKQYA